MILKSFERWGSTGIERWDRARLAEEFKTDFYKLGWFEPRCGIIQPAKLARGMKGLAESAGVTINENSPVTSFAKNRCQGLHSANRHRRTALRVPGIGYQCLFHIVSAIKIASAAHFYIYCHV